MLLLLCIRMSWETFLSLGLLCLFTWECQHLASQGCLPPAPHSQHPVVRNALFCLDTGWKSARRGGHGSHTYTKELLAYAFALSGNQDTKKEILKSLNEEAVKEGESF